LRKPSPQVPAAQRHDAPDGFDDAKRPSALKKPYNDEAAHTPANASTKTADRDSSA
jgi:hypothetical protein